MTIRKLYHGQALALSGDSTGNVTRAVKLSPGSRRVSYRQLKLIPTN